MKKMLMIVLAGLLAAPAVACDMDKKAGGDAMHKTKASSTTAKATKAKAAKTVAEAKAKATKS